MISQLMSHSESWLISYSEFRLTQTHLSNFQNTMKIKTKQKLFCLSLFFLLVHIEVKAIMSISFLDL